MGGELEVGGEGGEGGRVVGGRGREKKRFVLKTL